MTGVFEGQKRHRPGCAVGDAARVIPRNDTVLLTGNDEDRTFDILNDAVERQRRSLFLRFRLVALWLRATKAARVKSGRVFHASAQLNGRVSDTQALSRP